MFTMTKTDQTFMCKFGKTNDPWIVGARPLKAHRPSGTLVGSVHSIALGELPKRENQDHAFLSETKVGTHRYYPQQVGTNDLCLDAPTIGYTQSASHNMELAK
jgi:hypothetical protein